MAKKLWLVTFTSDALVWAESKRDAEAFADPGEMEVSVVEVDPQRYLTATPYGTSVCVASLLAAGDDADREDLREARSIPFGDGPPWWTDGHAMYPAPIDGWLAVNRPHKGIPTGLIAQVAQAKSGAMPVVNLSEPYDLSGGYSLDARYVDAAPPDAVWHWSGGNTAAIAMIADEVVAIVMPICK